MDRKLFFGINILLILYFVYNFYTFENILAMCFSVPYACALLVFVSICYGDFITRNIKLGNNIVVAVYEKFRGKNWNENNRTLKIDCLNKEIPVISYYCAADRTETSYISTERSGPIKYDYYKKEKVHDVIEILYIEFDNAEDNLKSKDELIKNFDISESQYISSGNKCAINLTSYSWDIIKSFKLI